MYTVDQIRELVLSGDIKCFYKDYYWRTLSLRIISENHGECYLCKKHGKYTKAKLVHHVKPLKNNPELAYCTTYVDKSGEHIQLMPLCHSCHEAIHNRSEGDTKQPEGFTNVERW